MVITALLFSAIGFSAHYSLSLIRDNEEQRKAENIPPEVRVEKGPGRSPKPAPPPQPEPVVEEQPLPPPLMTDSVLVNEAAYPEPVFEDSILVQKPAEPEGAGAANEGATEVAVAPESDSSSSFDPAIWAARHLYISVAGVALTDEWKEFLHRLQPGGVVLRDENLRDAAQTERLIAEIKSAVGLGSEPSDLPLIAVAQEGGAENRLEVEGAPSAAELGRTGDLDFAREAGRWYGATAVERGIAVVFAPVLDVYVPGTSYKEMTARSFGKDRQVVADLGLALSAGIRDGGALPVVKHFPGYGASIRDSNGGLAVIDYEIPRLAELMYPFNQAITQNIPGVVVGHIAAPVLDEQRPIRPASQSPLMVTEILRRNWRYDGVIVADDVNRDEIVNRQPVADAAVESLRAGCDAVLYLAPDIPTITEICHAVERAVADGTLTQNGLVESRRRLDAWGALLREPTRVPDPQTLVAKAEPEPDPNRELQKGEGRVQFLPPNPAPENDPDPKEIESVETDPAEIEEPDSTNEIPAESEAEPPADPSAISPADPVTPDMEFAAEPEDESAATEQDTQRPDTDPAIQALASLGAPSVPDPEPDEIDKVEPASVESDAPAPDVQESAPVDSEPLPNESDSPEPPVVVAEAAAEPIETASSVETTAPSGENAAETLSQPSADGEYFIHEVQVGDTLSKLAELYSIDIRDLVIWNNLTDSRIQVGQELKIYADAELMSKPITTYTVRAGDTLTKISKKYKTSPQAVMALNKLRNPNQIFVGQELRVPEAP